MKKRLPWKMGDSHQALLRHFDRNDPVMAGVIRQTGPFLLKRNRRYFIVLCKSIVAQQISTRAAETIFSRFRALFPNRSPTPSTLLALPEDRLRSAGLSRQKTAYLRDLSRRFVDRTLRPHQLPHLANEEVIRRLTRVHGIGRWTAEMFLIFSLNRLDVLPVDDLGLRTAIKNIYGLRENPTPSTLRELAGNWHPLETVATWYAWRFLNADIVNY